ENASHPVVHPNRLEPIQQRKKVVFSMTWVLEFPKVPYRLIRGERNNLMAPVRTTPCPHKELRECRQILARRTQSIHDVREEVRESVIPVGPNERRCRLHEIQGETTLILRLNTSEPVVCHRQRIIKVHIR